jgi:hypothetical protein
VLGFDRGDSNENNFFGDDRCDVFDGGDRVLVLFEARRDRGRLSENDLRRRHRHDHYRELPAGRRRLFAATVDRTADSTARDAMICASMR